MKRNENLLSAVIPITEMAGRLDCFKETVQAAQKKGIFLVIIHDKRDESTENELLEVLSKLDEGSYRFISGNFGSPGESRNRGIQEVTSEWITFWDNDDLPNVDNIVQAIQESETKHEVIIGNFCKVDVSSNKRVPYNLGIDWRKSVSINPGIWRMIFRTNSIENLRFSKLLMAEDQIFLVQYRIFDRSCLVSNYLFYDYHVAQPGQATNNSEALQDLKRSVEITFAGISSIRGKYLIYYRILFVKQALTGIKKLKLSIKAKMVCRLVRFFGTINPIQTLKIVNRIRVLDEK